MRKFPCYIQEERNDCGPACIKSILLYYHGDYDYPKLKEQLHLTSHGTSAYDMITFLNEHGFYAEGKRYDWKHWVEGKFILPSIALIKNEALENHYVIVYRIVSKKEKIWIGDPKEGIRVLSWKQFQSQFTGIMIHMIPTGIVAYEKSQTFNHLLCSFILRNKKTILLGFLLIFIFLILQIAVSFMAKYFMNGVALKKPQDYFYLLFVIFLILYSLRNCYTYFTQKYLFSLQMKLQTLLDTYLYQTILKDQRESQYQSQPSFLVEKREELYVWVASLFQFIQFLFFDFMLAFLLFSCLCLIQIRFSFFLLPFFLFTICYYLWIAKRLQHIEKQCRQEINASHTLFLESMENRSFIATAQLESQFIKKYQKKLFHFNKTMFTYFHCHKRMELFYQMLFTVFHLYLFLYFSSMASTDKITMGNFILFITVWQSIVPVLQNTSHISDIGMKVKFYYERLSPYFMIQKKESLFPDFSFQQLSCQNFTYDYYNDQYVFQNIFLNIYQGEKIILTGDSGSGKSTFLKCISGRLEIMRNQVFLNQLDLCDYQKEQLRSRMVLLTQEESLFHGTLFENITLGRSVEKEMLVRILRCTCVDVLIKKHPLGLQQMITNHGYNLSGGERQRIVLARLLLQPFEVLLIDEGFSEMDVSLERQIMKNLFYTFFQKTIIIVSHRLNNRDLFGRHLVFQDKQIMEEKECRQYGQQNKP